METSKHAKKIARVYQQIVDSLRRTDPILTKLLVEGHLHPSEFELIRSKATIHEAVQELLNVLMRKPSETYVCFQRALQDTEQDHIHRLLQGKVTRLDTAHRDVLLVKYQTLLDNIHLSGSSLLDALLEQGILDRQEFDLIQSKATSHDMINQLLTFLLRASPDQYQTFLQLLPKSDHKHVFDILRDKIEGEDRPTGLRAMFHAAITRWLGRISEPRAGSIKATNLKSSSWFKNPTSKPDDDVLRTRRRGKEAARNLATRRISDNAAAVTFPAQAADIEVFRGSLMKQPTTATVSRNKHLANGRRASGATADGAGKNKRRKNLADLLDECMENLEKLESK